MQLILASNSPRRRELLSQLNYPFSVLPAVGEELSTATEPTQIVKELASRKAAEVFATHGDCVVVGCDTVVDLDGQILGKPQDAADATRMLGLLSGKTHFVHTGVCVMSPVGIWLFCDSTQVQFRTLSPQEIASYVDSGQAFGKAGAYGIQDDSHFVASYKGDYNNVVGLPLYRLEAILQTIYKG